MTTSVLRAENQQWNTCLISWWWWNPIPGIRSATACVTGLSATHLTLCNKTSLWLHSDCPTGLQFWLHWQSYTMTSVLTAHWQSHTMTSVLTGLRALHDDFSSDCTLTVPHDFSYDCTLTVPHDDYSSDWTDSPTWWLQFWLDTDSPTQWLQLWLHSDSLIQWLQFWLHSDSPTWWLQFWLDWQSYMMTSVLTGHW